MQVVVNIPDDMWEKVKDGYVPLGIGKYLQNGTPLPKGHGKIIDANKIEWFGCVSEQDCANKNIECKDCKRAECDKRQVDAITAILEADGGDTE